MPAKKKAPRRPRAATPARETKSRLETTWKDTQAALVRQYEGAVKVDQSAIDNARLQLTYARITAPISGRGACAKWIRATW